MQNSRDFDSSLMIFIEEDMNNRQEIRNLIKQIPSELQTLLYEKLEEYQGYLDQNISIFELNEKDNMCLLGETIKDNIKYNFIIDMNDDSLTITESIIENHIIKKVKQIVLYRTSRYNNIDKFNREMIGIFSDYANNKKTECEIINTIFGKRIIFNETSTNKKNNRILKKLKRR